VSTAILSAVSDPSWGDLAQLGVIALAMIVGALGTYRGVVVPERANTERERQRAEAAESDAREVRDVFIREIVPATTLQTDRSAKLLEGLQQVVSLVERVVSTTLGPK
jgi:hypothetical protein